MFFTPTLVRKINSSNYKGYIKKNLNEETNSGDTGHAIAVLDFLKSKKLKNIKTEETLEGGEVKTVDLSDMLLLDGDEEKLWIYQACLH